MASHQPDGQPGEDPPRARARVHRPQHRRPRGAVPPRRAAVRRRRGAQAVLPQRGDPAPAPAQPGVLRGSAGLRAGEGTPVSAETARPGGKAGALVRILALRDHPFWVRSRKRRVARLLTVALYVYLGLLLVLLALENRLLFPGAYSSAGDPDFVPAELSF